MNERSSECLLTAATWYAKETLLDAGISRTYNNFVTPSEFIFWKSLSASFAQGILEKP
ncbi:hypothetical protein [Nostoc sp.]|uniref:hypothetical protein n=1 Tax=Nostoc sp. TaxID=1180 RepID=UPI002FFA117E